MDQARADELAEDVRRAAAGDREAWDSIVRSYSGLVWSVARGMRLGEHQTADVVQTTWMRLVEHLSSIRDPRRLASWLATTTRNTGIEAIRQARRLRPLAENFDPPSVAEQPDAVLLRVERAELVRAALARLAERDQLLLTALAASPPLPYEVISERLGMPIGSIGPTRMRALRRLQAELETAGLIDAAP